MEVPSIYLVAAAVAIFVVLIAVVFVLTILRKRSGKKIPAASQRIQEIIPEVEAPATKVEPEAAQPSLSQKLFRTRGLLAKLDGIWGSGDARALEEKAWDELEEALLGADVGFTTTTQLLTKVRERIATAPGKGMRELMQEECAALFSVVPQGPQIPSVFSDKPYVISIVGINGVGKTTTIGKLAHRFISDGRTVLMGAADTFRAAAISQLKIWSDRTGAQFVAGREGGDPGAVAFDSLTAAKARGIDIVLLDTAGRLHTKTNLMEELSKIHRVMKKVSPQAPNETWLVVDGTAGQNSVQQAREFQKILALTGVVVTKLDGTAKGGAILAISSELKLPIRFIGVGESMEDLIPFEPQAFAEAILGG